MVGRRIRGDAVSRGIINGEVRANVRRALLLHAAR